MHMLFQSEAAYRRRRVWMPSETTPTSATCPKDSVKTIGPYRRGMSRNCSTIRQKAIASERLARRKLKSTFKPEQSSNDEDKAKHREEGSAMTLRDEVLTMTMEIETLQRRRLLLDSARINARSNAMAHAVDLAKSFYVHFANGYDPMCHPEQSRQAETFLRGVMTKDVICSDFHGVDLVLNQYKVATQGHTSMRVFVHDIYIINEDEASKVNAIQVFAKASAHFRVNRLTLEKFFPRIIDDEELTQQLIGKEYAIQYNKVFHFKNGRIFQHESQVDFCNSMLELAQNPFVAMKLLEASLMTKHGHLKINSSIKEDMYQLENAVL